MAIAPPEFRNDANATNLCIYFAGACHAIFITPAGGCGKKLPPAFLFPFFVAAEGCPF